MEWIRLAHNRIQWQAVLRTVIKFEFKRSGIIDHIIEYKFLWLNNKYETG
jgi:hypothetical protein